jgi:7-alpha-hydroxysteroid dehydrogenase
VSTSNPFSLDGKVALITGGGRGIGAGIARSMAEAGASVAVVARTKEQVEAVADEINGAGGRALAVAADLNDMSVLDDVVERTVAELGGLDTVVNNAGGGNMWRPILDESAEQMDEAFHFHVSVPMELVRRAVPHLLERPGASIVNIVSFAIHTPSRGHLSYDAAKGAFHYATRSMAASLGPKIRVNSINPGVIETEAMRAVTAANASVAEQIAARIGMRRLGTPEDIGRAAVFLASPAASYVTGVAIDIDGGGLGDPKPRFPDL